MIDLSGRTALVTGSSRNIGRETAVQMAELGADVGVTAHSDVEGCAETAEAVESAGGASAVAVGDIGEPEDVDRVVGTIRDELGPIDVLVNNAVAHDNEPFLDVTTEGFDRMAAVNFRGVFQMTQAVAPDMVAAGRGSVVNLYGLFAHIGLPGRTHSFASKGAAAALVRQLASELGPDGVRVNGVAPGSVNTIEGEADEPSEFERKVIAATPLKRQGEAGEIADAVCFLASDAASFVTSQMLHVNGGLYPTPKILDIEG